MVDFYWFDHRMASEHNESTPRLAGLKEMVDIFHATMLRGVPNLVGMRDKVFFVHPGETCPQATWEAIAAPSRRIWIIFVSSAPPLRSETPGVYCMPHLLPSVVKYLSMNPDKVNEFIASCNDDNPLWKLFQPVKWPEHLVSAYLLLIAKRNNRDIQIVSDQLDLWTNALKEYEELLKEESIEGNKLSSFDDVETTILNISRLFNSIANRL